VIYEYPRFIREDGTWNINNPYDTNEDGDSVTLNYRVILAFPDKNVVGVSLNSETASINMDELTVEEKDQLDAVVAAHEAATQPINQTTYLYLIDANGVQWRIYIGIDGILNTELV